MTLNKAQRAVRDDLDSRRGWSHRQDLIDRCVVALGGDPIISAWSVMDAIADLLEYGVVERRGDSLRIIRGGAES